MGEGTSFLVESFFDPSDSIYFFFFMQSLIIFLFMMCDYPVIALSSAVISLASMTTPSAGTSIPSMMLTISPTKTLSWCTLSIYPFLIMFTTFVF